MMIFSTPSTFAASSATDLMLLPATNPWTVPPSFLAAVKALKELWFNWPSRCSKMAKVDSNRWRAYALNVIAGARPTRPQAFFAKARRVIGSIVTLV
jgi:hypothetical protein